MKSPLAVLAALVGALGLLVPGVTFSGATPAHAAPVQDTTAEHVILIGAAGLRWEDINPALTPTLWALAEDSALASMSVRSAQRHTCPADGWLTLGAGNQARVGDAGGTDDCEAALPTVELQEGGSALMRGARQIYDDNRTLYYRARPGVLAEMVRCTVAVACLALSRRAWFSSLSSAWATSIETAGARAWATTAATGLRGQQRVGRATGSGVLMRMKMSFLWGAVTKLLLHKLRACSSSSCVRVPEVR